MTESPQTQPTTAAGRALHDRLGDALFEFELADLTEFGDAIAEAEQQAAASASAEVVKGRMAFLQAMKERDRLRAALERLLSQMERVQVQADKPNSEHKVIVTVETWNTAIRPIIQQARAALRNPPEVRGDE